MPSIDIRVDPLEFWCVSLSKVGYGDINTLKRYSSEDFFNLLWYEQFTNDYQAEMVAINRRK